MNKTKLVLLTVLIMLVLYCGAVIFVTKPDSFAFSAIFGEIENSVKTSTSEVTLEEQRIERAAISEEIRSVSDQTAKSYFDQANSNVDLAVSQAMDKYSSELSAMVNAAVNEAYSSIEVPEAPTVNTKEIVNLVVKEIEAGLDNYISQIVSLAIPELLTYEDEFAQMLYDKYGSVLVDAVTESVLANITIPATTEVVEVVEEPVEIVEIAPVVEIVEVVEPVVESAETVVTTESEELDYEKTRQELRDTEINNLLNLLEN